MRDAQFVEGVRELVGGHLPYVVKVHRRATLAEHRSPRPSPGRSATGSQSRRAASFAARGGGNVFAAPGGLGCADQASTVRGVNELLERLGFAEDPFASTNAADEPRLASYFVPPPYFHTVQGDPRNPKSHVVLAPRGGGKTAQPNDRRREFG